MAPRIIRDTFRPELPRRTYCMSIVGEVSNRPTRPFCAIAEVDVLCSGSLGSCLRLVIVFWSGLSCVAATAPRLVLIACYVDIRGYAYIGFSRLIPIFIVES